MFFGPGAKFGRRLVEAPAADPGHEIWSPFVAKQCIPCCSAGLGRDLGGVPFEVFVQIAGQIVKPSEPLRELGVTQFWPNQYCQLVPISYKDYCKPFVY